MATENKTNGHYKSAREAFDGLKMDQKAVFLIESTVSMLVHGIEKAAKTVGEGLEEVFAKAEESVKDAADNATKKESASKKTTRSKSTRSRKTTSSTRKTRTKRTKPPEDKSE